MNEINIFKLIIDTMIMCQKNNLENKKVACMNIIKQSLPLEYEIYEFFISITIDALKMLSKNPIILKELNTNKCFKSCIKKIIYVVNI